MPIVSTIFAVLNSPVDERDQVTATEKRMLQRGYFSFLSCLVVNEVTEVLSNQGKFYFLSNQGKFCLLNEWGESNLPSNQTL